MSATEIDGHSVFSTNEIDGPWWGRYLLGVDFERRAGFDAEGVEDARKVQEYLAHRKQGPPGPYSRPMPRDLW